MCVGEGMCACVCVDGGMYVCVCVSVYVRVLLVNGIINAAYHILFNLMQLS